MRSPKLRTHSSSTSSVRCAFAAMVHSGLDEQRRGERGAQRLSKLQGSKESEGGGREKSSEGKGRTEKERDRKARRLATHAASSPVGAGAADSSCLGSSFCSSERSEVHRVL